MATTLTAAALTTVSVNPARVGQPRRRAERGDGLIGSPSASCDPGRASWVINIEPNDSNIRQDSTEVIRNAQHRMYNSMARSPDPGHGVGDEVRRVRAGGEAGGL